MGRRKKEALPFDKAGGVIAIRRPLLESESYLKLSAQAKVLMTLMQIHWRNDKLVDYGVREAMAKIPCAKGTAQRAFKELSEAGFIVMMSESFFHARTSSKARAWRLTWLPYESRPPTNEWKKN